MNTPNKKLVPLIPAPAWAKNRMEQSARRSLRFTSERAALQLKASAEYRRVEGYEAWGIEQHQLHLAGLRPPVSQAEMHQQAQLGAERIRHWEQEQRKTIKRRRTA